MLPARARRVARTRVPWQAGVMWCCCTEEASEQATIISTRRSLTTEEQEASRKAYALALAEEKTSLLAHQKDARPLSKNVVRMPLSSVREDGNTSGETRVPPPSFVAVVNKTAPDTPLGLHVDLSDGRALHVCSVRQGPKCPVAQYNSSAREESQLRAGDYIKAVNGVHGDANQIADALKLGVKTVLVVQRPDQFKRQVVRRETEPMGLDLNFSEKGSSLVIMSIVDGAVKRCAPDVRPGDRIVSVDGATGTALELLDIIQRLVSMELEISRCC